MSESSQNGSPAISVVIPAYNHERYIGETLNSVLEQSFTDFEVVVIDDGSPDGTGGIVKEIAKNDSRVHYIYQENQDAFNAINNGLKVARGEWLTILNSDDSFMPGRLERLWQAKDELSAEVLFTDVELMDGQSQTISDPTHFWHQWHQENRQVAATAKDLYAGFLHGNFMVTTSNLFYSRRAYDEVGNFSSLRYLHDYDYIFRLLCAFPDGVHYLADEKLVRYRLHGGNTLKEGAIKARKEDQHVIKTYLLEAVSEEVNPRVSIGVDRLVALERELAEIELSPVESLRSHGLVQKLMSLIRR